MKILLANKYFYIKGGAENSFFKTAELLEKNGHRVSYFSMEHPKNLPSAYSQFFVSNVDYEKGGFRNKVDASLKMLYSVEARKKIEKLLAREWPSIAHLNVIYHQISPSVIHSLKKFSVPTVMSLRDYKLVCASYTMMRDGAVCEACRHGRHFQCLLNKCVKGSRGKSLLNTCEMYLHHKILKLYDKIDVLISPSEFLKKKMEEMGFKGRIEYLPNFVNPADFDPVYTWDEKSVIYFGRLSEEKGLFTLIDALKDIPEIKLKVVGEGPALENLKNAVERRDIDNVKFYGYLNGAGLREEIRRSMFVILPSEWYENNPRAIIEAFALGKPALGARIGGIPELVKDNQTGLTFEAWNVQDLREKILALAQRPRDILEFGRNARKFVEENLNEEIHYRKLLQIYKYAIKERHVEAQNN